MNDQKIPPENRRRNLRFSSVETHIAEIDLDPDGSSFNASFTGLVGNESLSGARVIFVNAKGMEKGKSCQLKIGKLPVIKAKIEWSQPLGFDILVVGFQFLEKP